MIGEFDLESIVVQELCRARAADLVHFVEAGSGEEHDCAAVFEVETGLHDAEGDSAVAGGLDEVEVVPIPQVGPDDPPPPADSSSPPSWRRLSQQRPQSDEVAGRCRQHPAGPFETAMTGLGEAGRKGTGIDVRRPSPTSTS